MSKPFHHPEQIPGESKRRAEAILWDLYLQGPVEDPKGQATNKFADRLKAAGWPMSTATINRIVNGFGNRGGNEGNLYPYVYIERKLNGKRTLSISLVVDPDEVAFPDNPFENTYPDVASPEPRKAPERTPAVSDTKGPPVFLGTATLAPRKPRKEEHDAGETFARQRQFEGAAPEPEPETVDVGPVQVEPEPEIVAEPNDDVIVLDEVEPEPDQPEEIEDIPEVELGALEPYRNDTTVRTNGAVPQDEDELNLDDLGELPDDLFADLNGSRPQTAMEMVSAAISLLADAQAAHAGEQMHLATDVLDRHIDERLGEYRLLQDRLSRMEAKLRHTVGQYEKVVGIARTQRKQIIALQRELAKHRPKATASA